MTSRLTCTYTHMKSAKRKKWQDGVVVCTEGKLSLIGLREGEDPARKSGPALDTCEFGGVCLDARARACKRLPRACAVPHAVQIH